ncbi:hypothetical protein BH11ACT8_BH11ACT8_23610 [soil metagenome]
MIHPPTTRRRLAVLTTTALLAIVVTASSGYGSGGSAGAPGAPGAHQEGRHHDNLRQVGPRRARVDTANVWRPGRVEQTVRFPGPNPDGTSFADPGGRTGNGRPNVVLILTDDMTYSDLAYMPTVRHLLGDKGVTFDEALSAHPLCCPARAAILTGQYSQNNGVKSNQPPVNYDALDPGRALPVWLHRAGYQTAFTGKYLNGFGAWGPRQPGWDYWDATMLGQYDYNTYTMAGNGRRTQHKNDLNNIDYINHRVVRLVHDFSRSRKPFFIWASHVAPHGRVTDLGGGRHGSSAIPVPPRRYEGMFSHEQSPSLSDPGYTSDDPGDASPFVRGGRDYTPARVNLVFRQRIESLQAVDEGVADIVDALRRARKLDNTYLVFTSDNGFTMGEHRTMTKNLPYRQSVRVPFLVRGPGVPEGETRHDLIELIDVAPTIAEVANAKPAVVVDGVSLLPTLTAGAPVRTSVLIQAGPTDQGRTGSDGYWWRGVLTPRYTFARYLGENFVELYDRERDPAENVNVADDPRYASVRAELERRLELLKSCSGASQCSQEFPADPVPTDDPGMAHLFGG